MATSGGSPPKIPPTTADVLGETIATRGLGEGVSFLLAEYRAGHVDLESVLTFAEHAAARLAEYEAQRREAREILRGTGTDRQKRQALARALNMPRPTKRDPHALVMRWVDLTHPLRDGMDPDAALERLRAEGYGASADAVLKALHELRAANRRHGLDLPERLPPRRG